MSLLQDAETELLLPYEPPSGLAVLGILNQAGLGQSHWWWWWGDRETEKMNPIKTLSSNSEYYTGCHWVQGDPKLQLGQPA